MAKEYMDDEQLTFGTDKIYIRRSMLEGKGVFAKEDIKANDLIERFSMIPLHYRTNYQGDMSLISISIVKDDCPCEECKKHGHSMYIPQGYASAYKILGETLCNATLKYNYQKYYGMVMATKDIAKDEEISIPTTQSYHFKNYLLPKARLQALQNEESHEIRT